MSQCIWTAQGEMMCFGGSASAEGFAGDYVAEAEEDFKGKAVQTKKDDGFINCKVDTECKCYNKDAACVVNTAVSSKTIHRYCAAKGKKLSPALMATAPHCAAKK